MATGLKLINYYCVHHMVDTVIVDGFLELRNNDGPSDRGHIFLTGQDCPSKPIIWIHLVKR